MYIDTNRLDITKPIDLTSLFNTGLYTIKLLYQHAGVHLTDKVMFRYFILDNFIYKISVYMILICKTFFKGVHKFKAKINIEVQWASEPVISAIERNGGVITTAYYDMHSLHALQDAEKFFSKGNCENVIEIRDKYNYYNISFYI